MLSIRRLTTAGLAVAGAVALTAGLAGPAAAAPSDQDATWMNTAHRSNLAEIAAGTAAQEQATTDTVRDLGAMFVEMHTELDASLTAAAEELDVELDAEPTAEQQAQLADVEANEGEAFDTAWIAQQIGSHSASRAAGQEELAEGSDEQVLELARTSAPVIQAHLDELLAAADDYGVPTAVPGGSGGQVAGAASPLGAGLAGAGAVLVLASVGTLVLRRRRA